MAKYKITKTVDFGPWTIGDKNYGPSCPSCQVPINNYAPKVGDTIEGEIETKTYYVFENNKKTPKTGKGISFPIRTNGPASTQAQTSDQFITEDHLELQQDSSNETPIVPAPVEPLTPVEPQDGSCWICKNKIPLIIGAIIVIIIVIASIKD